MINAFSEDGDQSEAVVGDLQFDKVVFAYPTRKEVPVSICKWKQSFFISFFFLRFKFIGS